MKKLNIMWILLCATICLNACSRSYNTEGLTADIISAQNTAHLYNLNTAWWTGYGDTTLNRTVALALERNINLARTALTVSRARYKAAQSAGDLLPVVSGDGTTQSSRTLNSAKATPTWQQTWQGGANVNYELDLWRKLGNAADAAQWEHLATAADLASTRLALINSVVSAWFYFNYIEQAITATERSIQRYERLNTLMHSKYTLGKIDRLELLEAERSLISARNTLASFRSDRATAEQTLRDLMNLRPTDSMEVPQHSLLDIPLVPVDLNVPLGALTARPDIHAAEARLQSAFKTLEADKAAWYPDISVGSSLRLSSDKARKFFNVPILSGLVTLSLPFLDWNTLYWNVKISESDFDSAKLDLIEAVTTALNDVNASCQAYIHAREALDLTLTAHERDQKIALYYLERYECGAAELKDYLAAQNTAEQSYLAALSTKYELLSRESSIYISLGGRYEPRTQQ